ncbi:hypothetical protein D1AOALGA4SA_12667 [Olavius algarvensis Delta 1 endosymbiont]|nr:hypothetical protein D1AOALGA4SA_12667 [Olavius algarvensis Delta 1 endosymbiont]
MGKDKAIGRNGVVGLIIPAQWDENGKVIGAAIHTDGEEVFLVAHNRMESELLSHLHLKVVVKGEIRERLDGNKLIHVKSFKTIAGEGK